ncbi:helix-turn-helix transcriptional regulator [Jannaschia pohangensis]|uniref:DNA-binding transcriptional regulator, CsgD family n=1 Tax=Jannaschia pohangensis TaxID=390807 RepID=A0A1I3IT75_9RHOB|nr:helix-turn-helix transcriptional regulator [Jannaschia pohangensis]SFI51057.1 DNA-binding transcriptional regulator, CsgD family [Jannaschia pohangensis]
MILLPALWSRMATETYFGWNISMRGVPTTETLIETIYNCALGLADWHSLCLQMREAVPGMGVALHLHQMGELNNVGVVETGFDAAAFPDYVEHYMNVNPWLTGLERSPAGLLLHTDDIVPEEMLLRSEFWNDWLRPQGDYAAGSAIVLSRTLNRNCAILTNYSHRSESMRQGADDLLREVGPHIQQAFGLWCRSTIERERAEISEGCLGTLPMPLVIVDGHRKTRMVNEEADAILLRNDGLLLGANRELRAHDRCADAKLGQAIADAATRCRPATPILIEKRSTETPAGHYVVSAFPAPHQRIDMEFGNFTFQDGKLVALAIHDTSARLRLDPQVLSDAFGLTATEADLSCFMLNGATLADYARSRCVSRYTVRNQLCSIMHKTGTHRQSELIGRLTRIALTV